MPHFFSYRGHQVVYPDMDIEYTVVDLNTDLPPEVGDWLSNQFGDDRKRWFCSFRKIYFLNPSDHLMFLLRWSS